MKHILISIILYSVVQFSDGPTRAKLHYPPFILGMVFCYGHVEHKLKIHSLYAISIFSQEFEQRYFI